MRNKEPEDNTIPYVTEIVVFQGPDEKGPKKRVTRERPLRRFVEKHTTKDNPSCGGLIECVPPGSKKKQKMVVHLVVDRGQVFAQQAGDEKNPTYYLAEFSGVIFMPPSRTNLFCEGHCCLVASQKNFSSNLIQLIIPK
jgi:hypothetical protein